MSWLASTKANTVDDVTTTVRGEVGQEEKSLTSAYALQVSGFG